MFLGNFDLGKRDHYTALFTKVSDLKKGAPVRIAGVSVGAVDAVQINDGGTGASAVKVKFHVDNGVRLPAGVDVTVRFKNLIGDQYLQLDPGTHPTAALLRVGATIPATNTRAALDLDTLFQGFQPLLQGLDSSQINDLSSAIVNVLQGKASAVYQLIGSLSSLFGTLAQNDGLITQVISNLDTGLHGVAQNSGQLSQLVVQLEQLVSGLSADRKPIGASLTQVNALAASAASLLQRARPPLRTDVPALQGIASELNKQTDTLQYIFDNAPDALNRLSRLGSYGAFFNFYLCGLRFKLTGPTGQPFYTPFTYSGLARCKAS
jgi:phospholipid/cholesterol/gamma-HCH transport system substrate-binding protein